MNKTLLESLLIRGLDALLYPYIMIIAVTEYILARYGTLGFIKQINDI